MGEVITDKLPAETLGVEADPFAVARGIVEERRRDIPAQVYDGVQRALGAERLPPGIFEAIGNFPPEKRAQALVMVPTARAAFIVVSHLAGIVKVGTTPQNRGQITSLADELSSAIIQRNLETRFPDFGYLDEEVEGSGYELPPNCWIVDPVDGSSGVVRRLRSWAVGIALHENQDVADGRSGVTLGIVCSPQGDERDLIFGGRSLGSFDLDGGPVRVSQTTDPNQLYLNFGSRDVRTLGSGSRGKGYISTVQAATGRAMRTFLGELQFSAVLLASGSYDVLMRIEQKPHDVAPAVAICEGAGAQVRDIGWGEVVRLDNPIVVPRSKEPILNPFIWNGQNEVFNFVSKVFWSSGDMHRWRHDEGYG